MFTLLRKIRCSCCRAAIAMNNSFTVARLEHARLAPWNLIWPAGWSLRRRNLL